tara:strand:+ start:250 stop:414 length:165 start_codon:yes stop_codon:yes gene_type:complete
MVDQTLDEIRMVQESNKARIYQKRKQVEEQLKELLKEFDSDSLIDMLMKIKDQD